MKDEELKRFWTSYRGYVHLYSPIMARNEDEALEIARNMPNQPTKDLDLRVINYDLDFEIDDDYYIYSDSDVNQQEVPKAFSKQLLKCAITQGERREKARKEALKYQLEQQISQAQQAFAKTLADLTSKLEAL